MLNVLKKLVIFLGIFLGVLISVLILVSSPAVVDIVEDKKDIDEIKDIEIITSGLEIPWDVAFLPDGELLITERSGNLVYIAGDGSRKDIAIDSVRHKGEGGLLGVVLHPDFVKNNYIYLYLGARTDNGNTVNRVERYVFADSKLSSKDIIIDNIPGAIYHDGGRMEFGSDGLLYITTGDATSPDIAQDLRSLGGKILRLNDDGSIPESNPFADSKIKNTKAIYSYGHRNPQGIAWDSAGRLWATEHGRSGVLSGLDEINLIEAGKNYGWPVIEGDETREGMLTPIYHSTPSVTWAPASLAYLDGSLFFGGLRGGALYEAVLDGGEVVDFKVHFEGEFGRIRAVRVGTDGMLYITTSNRDGRGRVRQGDDKLIRINPEILK